MIGRISRRWVPWLADAGALAISFMIAVIAIRVTGITIPRILTPPGNSESLQFVAYAIAIQYFVFLWEGVYRREVSLLDIHGSRRLLRGITFTTLTLMIVSSLPMFTGMSVGVVLLTGFFSLLITPTFRAILASRKLPQFDRKAEPRELLILGNGTAGQSLLRRVVQDNRKRYKLVGFLENSSERVGQFITTDSLEVRGSAKILGTYDHFDQLTDDRAVDEIWINDPNITQDKLQYLFNSCKTRGIEVSLVPSIGEFPPQTLEVEMLDFIPVLRKKQVKKQPMYEISKRLIDILASGTLLFVMSPLLLSVAFLVRRSSPGPALFRQKRIGLNGKPFTMFKFRTMFTDSNPYSLTPQSSSDQRITKIGKFLRRTSLDELPQLLNVITGEMSLVGPRPEMPFVVDSYNDMERLRLVVKPGITGLWQLSADRTIPIHKNLDYDLFYIQNRSMMLDLTLLWRTLFQSMRGI
ncbi:sugar transferase [bacterium]|nr:sugar transferase [bacterium]